MSMATTSNISNEGFAHESQREPEDSSPATQKCDSTQRLCNTLQLSPECSQLKDQKDVPPPEDVTQGEINIIDSITTLQENQIFHHFATVTTANFTLPLGLTRQQMMEVIIRNIQQDKMILTTVLCLGASHLSNQGSSHMSGSELLNIVCVKDRLLEKANDEWISWLHPPQISDNSSVEEVARCELLILNNLLHYFISISEGLINESSLIHLDHGREILAGLLPWLEAADQESNTPDATQETRPIFIDRCLVHLFIYHDTLATVTSPRDPAYPPGTSLSSSLYGRISTIGIHDQVLVLILRIKDIESQAADARVLPPQTISAAVRVWQDVNNSIMSPATSSANPGERLLLESHLVAASIWLYSIIHHDGIADEKAQEMVQRGLQSLESLSTLQMQSCSLFPFFAIGITCIRPEDRKTLVGLFDQLDRTRHLRYTRICVEFIRETWRLYDGGSERSWDWSKVMKEKKMKVLVT